MSDSLFTAIYSSVPEQLEAPDDLDLDDDAFAPADAPPVGGPEDDGGVNADLGADTFGVAAEAPPAAESPSLNRVVAVALKWAARLPGLIKIVISLRRHLVGVAKVVKAGHHLISAVWRPTWGRQSFMVSHGSSPFVGGKYRRTGIS